MTVNTLLICYDRGDRDASKAHQHLTAVLGECEHLMESFWALHTEHGVEQVFEQLQAAAGDGDAFIVRDKARDTTLSHNAPATLVAYLERR